MNEHPVWGKKHIRAIFDPQEEFGLNEGTKQMVGHEFVWKFVAMWEDDIAIFQPADPEDIDAYYEVVGHQRPDWRALWILETDLYIIGIERSQLDG